MEKTDIQKGKDRHSKTNRLQASEEDKTDKLVPSTSCLRMRNVDKKCWGWVCKTDRLRKYKHVLKINNEKMRLSVILRKFLFLEDFKPEKEFLQNINSVPL